jgi:hypothetical protein
MKLHVLNVISDVLSVCVVIIKAVLCWQDDKNVGIVFKGSFWIFRILYSWYWLMINYDQLKKQF